MTKTKNNKPGIDEVLERFTSKPPAALREYMMLHSYLFFENFKHLADEYLDRDSSKLYGDYVNIIKTHYSLEELSEKVYLKDILLKALKRDDRELSKAVLYAVFIYPFNIARLSKLKALEINRDCVDERSIDELENKLVMEGFKDSKYMSPS